MKRIFQNAIVRKPCPEMLNGLTTSQLGRPDFIKALEQHAMYVEILKECGLQVTVLDGDNKFPDSTFIEDVAICTSHCAVITNPGAITRNGEIDGMRQVLRKYYNTIEVIKSPGTLDGGDVMMVDNHFYVGISERTDHDGAEQLIRILQRYGMTGSKVPLNNMLHLKTGLSYLEQNNLLIGRELLDDTEFEGFNRIVVEEDEAYAANSLWINGIVIIPRGYHKTKRKIEKAGYSTIETDVSEYQKLDGGLSCLSLRF